MGTPSFFNGEASNGSRQRDAPLKRPSNGVSSARMRMQGKQETEVSREAPVTQFSAGLVHACLMTTDQLWESGNVARMWIEHQRTIAQRGDSVEHWSLTTTTTIHGTSRKRPDLGLTDQTRKSC